MEMGASSPWTEMLGEKKWGNGWKLQVLRAITRIVEELEVGKIHFVWKLICILLAGAADDDLGSLPGITFFTHGKFLVCLRLISSHQLTAIHASVNDSTPHAKRRYTVCATLSIVSYTTGLNHGWFLETEDISTARSVEIHEALGFFFFLHPGGKSTVAYPNSSV